MQRRKDEYLGHQQHSAYQEQQVQRRQEQEQRRIQQQKKKTDLRALSASPTMYDFSKSRVRPPTPRPFVPFSAAAATTATTSSVALGLFHGAGTEVRETSGSVAEMAKADTTRTVTSATTATGMESTIPRNAAADFGNTSNTASAAAAETGARPATPVMAKTSAKPPMSPKPRRKRDHPQRPSSATGT